MHRFSYFCAFRVKVTVFTCARYSSTTTFPLIFKDFFIGDCLVNNKSMMKLITCNFLTSKCIRGVKVGYPLKLNITHKETTTAEFNPEFITRIIPRLDWPTVCAGAKQVGCTGDLPATLSENYASDNELLQKLHNVLMEIDVIEGNLECPETGRIFPITEGIPNMVLNEDEV